MRIRGTTAAKRRLLAYVVVPVAMFALGYGGAFQWAGKGLTLFFKHYTEAELRKLEAGGFINSDGEAEYVVGVRSEELDTPGSFLQRQTGVVKVRETAFSDWFIVTVDAERPDIIPRIRELPQIQFVLQNRGLWICH